MNNNQELTLNIRGGFFRIQYFIQ